jgi:hypothetical protein
MQTRIILSGSKDYNFTGEIKLNFSLPCIYLILPSGINMGIEI